MSAIERIAHSLGRRDEEPNKDLAADLAKAGDAAGVAEIVAHLSDRNQSIAGDCIGVLYHVGYRRPELIAPYLNTFVGLLDSRNNRMQWGAMIALLTITPIRPAGVFNAEARIRAAMERGSVITHITGVKLLAELCTRHSRARGVLAAVLVDEIVRARPLDVAITVEAIAPALARTHAPELLAAVERRLEHMSKAQRERVGAALRQAGLEPS